MIGWLWEPATIDQNHLGFAEMSTLLDKFRGALTYFSHYDKITDYRLSAIPVERKRNSVRLKIKILINATCKKYSNYCKEKTSYSV